MLTLLFLLNSPILIMPHHDLIEKKQTYIYKKIIVHTIKKKEVKVQCYR